MAEVDDLKYGVVRNIPANFKEDFKAKNNQFIIFDVFVQLLSSLYIIGGNISEFGLFSVNVILICGGGPTWSFFPRFKYQVKLGKSLPHNSFSYSSCAINCAHLVCCLCGIFEFSVKEKT